MADAKTIIFYDARCSFCRTWRQWYEDAAGSAEVTFVDANDKPLAQRLGIHDTDQLDRRMCILDSGGRIFWGYDAAVQLLANIPSMHPIIALLERRPIRVLGQRLYDWTAARRACLI